ncbi:hypothetical protein SAMN05421636_11121 [Pricia antarctica]|uniref:Uncharacterized protein n=1 Tax=Pricia antarctica TaxID=641691 RepID=A0A1G7I540_9FLAO|nr:hypothetical protein SAMN05421636_11121 [Pricia antarctica]
MENVSFCVLCYVKRGKLDKLDKLGEFSKKHDLDLAVRTYDR